jgi:hypothetical protein
MRRLWLVFTAPRSLHTLAYNRDPRMAGRDPIEEGGPCDRPGCDGTYERNSAGRLYCGECSRPPRNEGNRK